MADGRWLTAVWDLGFGGWDFLFLLAGHFRQESPHRPNRAGGLRCQRIALPLEWRAEEARYRWRDQCFARARHTRPSPKRDSGARRFWPTPARRVRGPMLRVAGHSRRA